MTDGATTEDRFEFLEERYAAALEAYVEAKAGETAEAALHRAYNLGRGAVTGGVSLLDLALVHRRALADVLKGVRPGRAEAAIRQKAWECFLETLGPYEMTQRGFREVYGTLISEIAQRRHIQEELEVHRQHLEEMVDQRTAELKRANESLRKEMDMRIRAQEELTRVNRALRTISQCNRAVVAATQESELLDRICQIIVDVGGYVLVCVGFPQDDPEKTVRLASYAARGKAPTEAWKVTWADDAWGRGPTGTAIRTRKPHLVEDLPGDPDCAPWRAQSAEIGAVAAVGLPLLGSNGRVLGALSIFASERGVFQEEEMNILQELAGDLAYGIQALRSRDQRVQAERALRDSEERYRTLVENIQLGVSLISTHYTIVMANAAHGHLFGKPTDSLIGRHCYEALKKRAEVCPNCPGTKAMATGKRAEVETEGVRADGSRFTALVEAFPTMGANGTIEGFIEIVEDVTERRRAERELKESDKKLRRMMQGTIQAITSALEMRDPYTVGHERRVADLACAIAGQMGLPEHQIEGIRIAGYVHDIGKIAVPAEILAKPGKLTNVEFAMIKTHPKDSYEILKEVELAPPVAQAILQHHERLDGSGYPEGLSGDQIIMEARILGVADVVEAMSSHRPYRPALGIKAALEEIAQRRGTLYDPQVADACAKLLEEERFRFE